MTNHYRSRLTSMKCEEGRKQGGNVRVNERKRGTRSAVVPIAAPVKYCFKRHVSPLAPAPKSEGAAERSARPTRPSPEPVAKNLPSGLQRTAFTLCSCPETEQSAFEAFLSWVGSEGELRTDERLQMCARLSGQREWRETVRGLLEFWLQIFSAYQRLQSQTWCHPDGRQWSRLKLLRWKKFKSGHFGLGGAKKRKIRFGRKSAAVMRAF